MFNLYKILKSRIIITSYILFLTLYLSRLFNIEDYTIGYFYNMYDSTFTKVLHGTFLIHILMFGIRWLYLLSSFCTNTSLIDSGNVCIYNNHMQISILTYIVIIILLFLSGQIYSEISIYNYNYWSLIFSISLVIVQLFCNLFIYEFVFQIVTFNYIFSLYAGYITEDELIESEKTDQHL